MALDFLMFLSLSVTVSLSLSLINSQTFFFPSKLKFNVILGSGLYQRQRIWSRCRGRGAGLVSNSVLFRLNHSTMFRDGQMKGEQD